MFGRLGGSAGSTLVGILLADKCTSIFYVYGVLLISKCRQNRWNSNGKIWNKNIEINRILRCISGCVFIFFTINTTNSNGTSNGSRASKQLKISTIQNTIQVKWSKRCTKLLYILGAKYYNLFALLSDNKSGKNSIRKPLQWFELTLYFL